MSDSLLKTLPYLATMTTTSLVNVLSNANPAVVAATTLADIASMFGIYKSGKDDVEDQYHDIHALRKEQSNLEEVLGYNLNSCYNHNANKQDETEVKQTWSDWFKDSVYRPVRTFVFDNLPELMIVGGILPLVSIYMSQDPGKEFGFAALALAKLCVGAMTYSQGQTRQTEDIGLGNDPKGNVQSLRDENERLRTIQTLSMQRSICHNHNYDKPNIFKPKFW